jgi:hypothetical protein
MSEEAGDRQLENTRPSPPSPMPMPKAGKTIIIIATTEAAQRVLNWPIAMMASIRPLAIVSDNRTIARPRGWHSHRRLVIVTNVIRITPAALKAI